MKSLFGLILFGLVALAIGLVWAAEEDPLRKQAELRQLETEKAAEDEAARARKEAEKLADQARRIDEKRAERLRTMSAEERERQEAVIRERLSNLEKMRETLGKKLGEDHPQIEAITRELDILREELQELSLKAPTLKEEMLDQELARLHEQLSMHLKYRDKLAQELSRNHPKYLEVQDKTSALQKLIQDKEGERAQAAQAIEHLRSAAEHLEQAGMPELAQELRRRAEDLKRKLQGGQSGQADALKELQEQMRDMQQAIKKLDEEVAGLREQLKKANE